MKKALLTEVSIEELDQLIQKSVAAAINASGAQKTDDGDELLTVAEAAEFLKCTKVSIHVWKRDKGLKFHKIGRSTRFKKSELLEFLTRRKT